MTAILMYLKQPNCVFSTCLWLMTLSVVNAEVLKNEPERRFLSQLHRKARSLASEPIEVAALGRPLYPGMLYDSRKDTFIPGVTLWDKKALSEDLDSRSQLQTDLKFSSSDSLSSKSHLLDVSASLKASFLGGLVEVGGSAKYLSDTKSSNQQSRVTMFYRETSRFEQLSMTHLGKITYPQVFDQKTATHVVSAVLYGAQAFMVFDRTFSDQDDKKVIEGELNVMVKKIPSFSIEGHGAVKMDDSEKKMAEQISCTFHGDFRLEQNPTTYLEAVEIYKKLPSMLKENPQNVVPLKVWLYPLSLLDSKAARLERELSSSQVANIEDIVEDLGEVERLLNDLFTNPIVGVFREIRDRLNSFKSSFHMYKTLLLKAVARVLPAIRGGEKDDQALEEIVRIHNDSPFDGKSLKQWLADTKSEILLLSSNTKILEWVKSEDSDGLDKLLLDPDVDVVVSLTFTSLQYEDPYLSTLKEFLKSDDFKETSEKQTFSVASEKMWSKDRDIFTRMRENLLLFRGIAESNKHKTKYRFVFSAISDSSSPGSSIYLYENGRLTNEQFKPMPKPPAPIVTEAKDQKASLTLQESPGGETVQFRVEYMPTSRSAEHDQWLTRDTADKNYILTGLQPNKQYWIRYRTQSKLGVSEASNYLSFKSFTLQPWLVGGTDGSDFHFKSSSGSTVKRVRISINTLNSQGTLGIMKGIQVTFHSNEMMDIGDSGGNFAFEMSFGQDDKIEDITLWPTKDEKRLGGIHYYLSQKDGSLAAAHVFEDAGEAVSFDVKSGKMSGVRGRIGDELYALGFDFV